MSLGPTGPAGSPDERVPLLDERGRVVGEASRERVRRENLRHGSVAVVVRDPAGRVYLHRRSPHKDWAPSHHDAAAGGVLHVGEGLEQAARRELAEELGITGVELVPRPGVTYEDDQVRCVLHAFETTYDGPVHHADGEVVWGRWVTLAQLGDLLLQEGWPFVPDTRALLRAWAAAGVRDYAVLAATLGVAREP